MKGANRTYQNMINDSLDTDVAVLSAYSLEQHVSAPSLLHTAAWSGLLAPLYKQGCM